MDSESGNQSTTSICNICNVCNNPKKGDNTLAVHREKQGNDSQDHTPKEKLKSNLPIPFGNKLHNFKQMLETTKSTGVESNEKKGLLQRMHSSLSLLKSKEKITDPVAQIVQLCECDENADTWFHTWPERGKDKLKSPKRTSKEVLKEANECIPDDVFLEQLPVMIDPLTKQIRVMPPKADLAVKDEQLHRKEFGHRRQPSLLSTVSSTGSEIHLPLMPLHSNPHSHTSLSSLSNYSSSTDFTEHTNSLERSCEPPRFGIASFWQRAFTRKSDTESASASWNLFSRSSFFQKSRSGLSSRGSLNSSGSPTLNPRSIGSTGLILQSRPSFLPAKCPEEELHHKTLHSKLLEESQRREQTKILVILKFLTFNINFCKTNLISF